MGGLDWWLDNLASKETILRRHYSPDGFLYLCHTSTRQLMEELRASLRPLASLPIDCSARPEVQESVSVAAAAAAVAAATATPPVSVATSPKKSAPAAAARCNSILKSPTRSKAARPLSFVQNSANKATSAPPPYRRAQSQHYDSSPTKRNTAPPATSAASAAEEVEEFSSLKKKWESLCGQKGKPEPAVAHCPASPLKSKIPRPVSRYGK